MREWVLEAAWFGVDAGGLLGVGCVSGFGMGGGRGRERSPSEADSKPSALTKDSELEGHREQGSKFSASHTSFLNLNRKGK